MRFEKQYVEVKDLEASMAGQDVRIRCRVHNSRAKGKMCFIVGRQGYATVQAVLFVGETISKGMGTFSSKDIRKKYQRNPIFWWKGLFVCLLCFILPS